MKIAFMVSIFPALSETFILNQIIGLIDRGYDVKIFANQPGDFPKTHADVSKRRLQERTYYPPSINKFMPRNMFSRVIKAWCLLMVNFPKNPVALMNSLNFIKFGKEALSLRLFYKIIPYVQQSLFKYDIIQCHFGDNGNRAVFLKDVGVIKGKIFTTFHGYDISHSINSRGIDFYDNLFKNGDLFLPISEKWKDELIKLGCEEKKIVVHKMGVDLAKFVFSPQHIGERREVKILTISRLVEKKGVEYGIRAVAKVLEGYPQVQYKIIGDGPLRGHLQSLISSLGIEQNVHLLGWEQQDDLIGMLQDSDILLAPSVTSENGDQEGIPVVLMEAMAIGIPVVSTQHSGIPELIENGTSGFLVPERDVVELYNTLMYIIDHPEIFLKIQKHARNHVETHHDINKLNDRLVGIYQKLLSP
jgi:colanic acid/amylovoran biosynthesis glycosyltransferase